MGSARCELGEQPVEATDSLGAQRTELIAAVRQQAQAHQHAVGSHGNDAAAIQCGESDRDGVIDVCLAAVPLGVDPHSSSQLGWHVKYDLAVDEESLGQGSTGAVTPLDCPPSLLPSCAELTQLPVTGRGVGKPLACDHDLGVGVHDCCGVACLVRINTDHHVVAHAFAS
jgi:hypothetical protein